MDAPITILAVPAVPVEHGPRVTPIRVPVRRGPVVPFYASCPICVSHPYHAQWWTLARPCRCTCHRRAA